MSQENTRYSFMSQFKKAESAWATEEWSGEFVFFVDFLYRSTNLYLSLLPLKREWGSPAPTIGIYPTNRLHILRWSIVFIGSGEGCELTVSSIHQSSIYKYYAPVYWHKGSLVDIHNLLRRDETIKLYDFFCRRLRKMANADVAVKNPSALFFWSSFPTAHQFVMLIIGQSKREQTLLPIVMILWWYFYLHSPHNHNDRGGSVW
jgi:hypothetical protein